jgi:hypothetical protein
MADQGLILHVIEIRSWHTFSLQSIIEKILRRFIFQWKYEDNEELTKKYEENRS